MTEGKQTAIAHLDPFEMMDHLDEKLILSEIEGRIMDTWCYTFKQGEKDIWGLSKVGVDQCVRELAQAGEVVREVNFTYQVDPLNERYVLFSAIAERVAVGKDGTEVRLDTKIGTQRQCTYVVTKYEGVTDRPDEFWFEKGSQKALRNAKAKLLPEEIKSRVIAKAKELKKFETVEVEGGKGKGKAQTPKEKTVETKSSGKTEEANETPQGAPTNGKDKPTTTTPQPPPIGRLYEINKVEAVTGTTNGRKWVKWFIESKDGFKFYILRKRQFGPIIKAAKDSGKKVMIEYEKTSFGLEIMNLELEK